MSDKKIRNSTITSPQINIDDESDESADFERAIAETQFGFYNLLLFLATVPSELSSQFETSSLSYVFPAAQCDLSLSLNDRGLINAVLYAGMIGGCFIWGPLVDVFGRRKILIISHTMDCIFMLMATVAPNLAVLIVAKFFGGFVINGPAMALPSYLSEFHGTRYRSMVPLTIGIIYHLGNICLPFLAWTILPLNIRFTIFNSFEFHAWNLFLLVCTLPAFISGIIFILFPESPKYTMSKGDNESALKTFKQIFQLNTKKSQEEYPVKKLLDDKQILRKEYTFKDAWTQISPLFSSRYRAKLILVCFLQLFLMMCANSLRLWLPEIFQVVNDHEYYDNKANSFCDILNTINSVISNEIKECSMNFNNSSVYINSIFVGLSTVVGYIVAALCINKLGKKRMLIALSFISAISVGTIYFASNSIIALILICIYIMGSCICIDVVITVIVDLFPTQLRASALSLAFLCGRIGSVFGNLTFPILLGVGCASVFFTQACIIIICVILAMFLPNTHMKALE